VADPADGAPWREQQARRGARGHHQIARPCQGCLANSQVRTDGAPSLPQREPEPAGRRPHHPPAVRPREGPAGRVPAVGMWIVVMGSSGQARTTPRAGSRGRAGGHLCQRVRSEARCSVSPDVLVGDLVVEGVEEAAGGGAVVEAGAHPHRPQFGELVDEGGHHRGDPCGGGGGEVATERRPRRCSRSRQPRRRAAPTR
jgi:hypothetical protein